MRRAAWALIGLALAGCDRKAEPRRLDPVPAELAPRVTLAESAANDLRSTLQARLSKAVADSGPEAGIEVCAKEAHTLTAEVAKRHGLELGRTSTKLRNPDNAPRAWVQAYLAESAGKPAADVAPAVYDLGSKLGVVQPLLTMPLCTKCHGDPAKLSPAVKAALAERYPKDHATGFAVGDLRGALWIEVAKSP